MEIEWLDDLEARIHEAAERLKALKEKNGALERRVADLEDVCNQDDSLS